MLTFIIHRTAKYYAPGCCLPGWYREMSVHLEKAQFLFLESGYIVRSHGVFGGGE